MKLYQITYITYTFLNKQGKEIEKTKTIQVEGVDVGEAERNFLNMDLKFKKIKTIEEDKTPSLGNMFPELLELRKRLN